MYNCLMIGLHFKTKLDETKLGSRQLRKLASSYDAWRYI